MRRRLSRGQTLACLTALGCFLLPACESFSLFGYTTQPLYNREIHTVRVPIAKNNTYLKGLEYQLTEAVIREIELKTPYKIVTAGCPADTELTCKIVTFNKNVVNNNQLNGVREAETTLGVEVVWRDLRPGHGGEFLSVQPKRPPSTEAVNPPPPLPPTPPVVLVQSLATFQPELGTSLATARQVNVDRLAVQIVSMMEKPW
jgi:hypothetical protein